MAYVFVGAGQAGGAIIDAVFGQAPDTVLDVVAERTAETPVGGVVQSIAETVEGVRGTVDVTTLAEPLVINSTGRDLQNLGNVPIERQLGISRSEGLVERTSDNFEQQVTGGFGRDPVAANEVIEQHYDELVDRIEQLGAVDEEDVTFAMVAAALGGGTGCGVAPHVIRAINECSDDTAPVIAVCVLPAADDEEGIAGGRQAWNARYGLDRIEDVADGIILVDNDRISYRAAAESQFGEYNNYVAAALHELVMGPMIGDVDPAEFEAIDTPDIDVQDLATAVSFGIGDQESAPGYAAVGRSVTMTRSLPGYVLPKVGRQSVDSAALARLSTSKGTLSDVDPVAAKKAISLVRAPAEYIRPGDKQVRTNVVQEYLQGQCGIPEVNIGVALRNRHLASVTTLLTYQRDDVHRIAELERVAERYEAETTTT